MELLQSDTEKNSGLMELPQFDTENSGLMELLQSDTEKSGGLTELLQWDTEKNGGLKKPLAATMNSVTGEFICYKRACNFIFFLYSLYRARFETI